MPAPFRLVMPDGREVETDSIAAAIRLKGRGASEAPRARKVSDAVDALKESSVEQPDDDAPVATGGQVAKVADDRPARKK